MSFWKEFQKTGMNGRFNQINRAERRQYGKRINTPQKMEQFSDELERRIRAEYNRESEKRILNFIEAYTTFTAYVLNYKLGLGKKRLPEIMSEIKRHIDMLDEGYISLEDCKSELKRVGIELKFN